MQYKKRRIQNTEYGIRNTRRVFTFVELIVSIGLFAIVMLISVGALLALTGANRKAQALQSVMNNLNIALDGMVRSIRMGSDYHCGSGVFVGTNNLDDCSSNGGTRFVFKPFDGNPNQWIYLFDPDGTSCEPAGKSHICKSVDGGTNYVALTSEEVTIKSMNFYVQGTTPGCDAVSPCLPVQPKVVITMEGTAGVANTKTETTFSIQATAVQRLLDL